MKFRHPINLHKSITAFVVTGMMIYFHNYSTAALVYLALHGSYGLLWILKDYTYPDSQWQKQVSIPYALFVFFALGLYWVAPFILISEHRMPNDWIIAVAVALNMFGMVLHFGSDAQKYYTLKYKPGLITEGFFARCRNPNYLGEMMIYSGFALLSMSWIGFIGVVAFTAGAFIPGMIRKEKSLSRYAEYAEYKKRSGLLLPQVW